MASIQHDVLERLMKGSDGNELAAFLTAVTLELDSTMDIDVTQSAEQIALEVKARRYAADKLKTILGVLFQGKEKRKEGDDKNQYVV